VEAGQTPTFRASVDLVTVDVAVHDGDGRPLPSLSPDDFRLDVDGRPRTIVSAQFLAQTQTAHTPPPSTPGVSEPADSGFSTNEGIDVGRTIIVAVDEPHIRRLEGRHALAAASRFIDQLPPSDRVGVVGLTNAAVVTLTRDRALLKRRLETLIGTGDPMVQTLNLGISEALDIAEGSRSRLADAVLRECGRSLTEYVNTARAADDPGNARDACPEQVEQESRAMAQFAHLQAGISVAALQALVNTLKEIAGPKTIVLVSEGMIVDPRRVDLTALATQAHAARVTIYGLQLEMPVFEAAQDRVSPTAQRDLQVRHDGVARVAGAARGAVFRQVGTDPKPFERIQRELSGYYLLAFEARDGDRDGKPHRIRVRLARGGGDLRARTTFTLSRTTPETRAADLTTLLRTLTPVTELPLRVATYAYAEPARRGVRVVVSAEADQRGTAETWLGFVLIDSAGVIAATATHQSGDGRHSFTAVVPPGLYTLRAAAIDALGRQGSVDRMFRAHAASETQLHVGDLLLAPPPASPGAPLAPIVHGISGSAILGYLEMRIGSGPRPESVRMHVAQESGGSPLVTATAQLTNAADGVTIARASMAIGQLPPGSYEVRADILSGGDVVARASRPFRIAR
jgi:VWFA-related protein